MAVLGRRFLSRFSGLRTAEPKQSTDIKEIASLRNARNDNYKMTRNEYNSPVDREIPKSEYEYEYEKE
jgi:hypothetical protein